MELNMVLVGVPIQCPHCLYIFEWPRELNPPESVQRGEVRIRHSRNDQCPHSNKYLKVKLTHAHLIPAREYDPEAP